MMTGPAETGDTRRSLIVGGFALLAFAAVVLQKIGLPVPGGELGLDTPLLIGTLAWLFTRRAVELDPWRVLTFAVFVLFAVIGQALATGPSSIPAFGILVALYACLCFVAPVDAATAARCLRIFQRIMVVIACVVIAQQVIQYSIGNRYWPNLDAMLPSSLLYDGFAYLRRVSWDSPNLKPNAVVFLEPSAVSLYLGAAVTVELLWFRRLAHLGLLTAGMVLTLAGTGPLMLVIASPLILARMPIQRAAVFGIAAAVLLAGAGVTGMLDPFFARAGELTDPQSSGYRRVIVPITAIVEQLADPELLISGQGAGSSAVGENIVQWPFQKLTHEYGLLAAISFHIFLFVAMLGRPLSRALAITILIPHELFGGGFVSHANVMLLILLATLLGRTPALPQRSAYRAGPGSDPSDSDRDTPP